MMGMTDMGNLTYEAAAYVQGEPGIDGAVVHTFRMTSDRVDRQGEVVTLDGWDFTAYLTNPVVLNSHQYGDIRSIVGRCIGITRDDAGWNAAIRFNSTEYGRLASCLVEEGDLRAVSVGFRPLMVEYPDGTMRPPRDTTTRQAKIAAPPWLSANARRGLEWHADGRSGDGVTAQTVREARAMAAGQVSPDKAMRMAAWFARHMPDLDAPAAQPGHDDYPSPGVVAHALWGGGSKSASERAAAWARAQAAADAKALVSNVVPPGKAVRHLTKELLEISVVPIPANADAVRLRMAPHPITEAVAMYAENQPTTEMTPEETLWQCVAHAMYVVTTAEDGDETVRRRRYNALERLYRTLDREPPAYTTAATAAKLQPGRDPGVGPFWEGEPVLVAAKVGRVVSTATAAKLMTAVAAMEALGDHLEAAAASLDAAEAGIHGVLGTMGVMPRPDNDEEYSAYGEDKPAGVGTAAKAEWDASALRDWLGVRP